MVAVTAASKGLLDRAAGRGAGGTPKRGRMMRARVAPRWLRM